MFDDRLLILRGDEVGSLLAAREVEVVRAVQNAYEAHFHGRTSLPHSTFLTFGDQTPNRIIALPAYLNGNVQIAGIKWISSFTSNHTLGMERASALIVLNSPVTGRPQAIMEGSRISAKRTAASAALAAEYLMKSQAPAVIGIIGCGPIGFETLRFLLAVHRQIARVVIFDIDEDRMRQFRDKWGELEPELEFVSASDVYTVLSSSNVVVLATTASKPYLSDLNECAPGTLILNISWRDLPAETILACDNIVDDVDHVCRAHTSIHLAEQLVGHRRFIRGTLGEVLNHAAPAKSAAHAITIFSPFGLGILDMAVSKMVYDLAVQETKGSYIDSFFPLPELNPQVFARSE